MSCRYVLCVLLAAAATVLQAQGIDVERVLLPITVKDVPGAFGSRWSTDLSLLISLRRSFFLEPLFHDSDCDPPCLSDITVIPTFPFAAGFYKTHSYELPGSLMYVGKSDLDEIFMSLRLRELSSPLRPSLQLPVVRERDFFARQFQILGVPTTAGWRATLRIYGIDPHLLPAVRVRTYAERSDNLLLKDEVYQLQVVQQEFHHGTATYQLRPPALELANVAFYAGVAETVRFEITPLDGNMLWAFVSVTNNSTGEVTLRTPR